MIFQSDNSSDTNKDFSQLIFEASLETRQIKAGLDEDFDNVSTFIAKLPPSPRRLQTDREAERSSVASTNNRAHALLNSSSKNDAKHYVDVKFAMATYLLGELPVVVLGDEA